MLGVVALFPLAARAEGFGPAHGGDDGWLPALALEDGASAWRVAAGAVYSPGYVPPFRAGARDRLAFGVGARWMPDRRVQVAIGFDGLADRSAGASTVGPGDFRLGTSVLLVDRGLARVSLGWAAKLPDASDEDELGSDETDVSFGGGLELHRGDWRAQAGAGLGVWGNPLRFANQDDVPELRLSGAWTPPPVHLGLSLDVDVGTARNPARVVAGGWVRRDLALGGVDSRSHLFVELGGGAGLTPAAPDGLVALSFGFGQAPMPLAARPASAGPRD